MAANQKQIAEKLGVSIALVSRVLSGKAADIGISPDTIDRVLATAREMDYVPNAAALSLKGKATRTLGVAVYDFNDPFFGTLIKEIQTKAHELNYSLVLAGFLNRIPDEQDVQSLYKHALDGLVVIGTDLQAEWQDGFAELPIARIGHGGPAEQSVRVCVDEDHAAALLIEHLREIGRSHPVYISANLPAHRIRKQAMQRAAANLGMDLTIHESPDRDAFAAGTQAVQSIASKTDSLLCATDLVAMGALHALYDTGVSVPGDLVATGFDDIPGAAQFIPPITTIRQPVEQIVEQVFSVLIDGDATRREILLPGKLMHRQTS